MSDLLDGFLADLRTFLREFPNNFRTKVKPEFDFLVSERGYTLLHFEVSDFFDNGHLIYAGPCLRLEIIRDRGSVGLSVRAIGDHRDFGKSTLLRMLGGESEPPTISRDSHSDTAASVALFLREHLTELEERFAPERREDTIRRCEELSAAWVKAFFARHGIKR